MWRARAGSWDGPEQTRPASCCASNPDAQVHTSLRLRLGRLVWIASEARQCLDGLPVQPRVECRGPSMSGWPPSPATRRVPRPVNVWMASRSSHAPSAEARQCLDGLLGQPCVECKHTQTPLAARQPCSSPEKATPTRCPMASKTGPPELPARVRPGRRAWRGVASAPCVTTACRGSGSHHLSHHLSCSLSHCVTTACRGSGRGSCRLD